MSDLQIHLKKYGIRHFNSMRSWQRARNRLENEVSQKFDRADVLLHDHRMTAFYDLIADPALAGLMHSIKGDAINQSGSWLNRQCRGRERICELGCSIGFLTTWYGVSDERRRVLGVDRSRRSVKQAESHATALGVANVRFERADITTGIPGGNYDAIVESQVLHESTDLSRGLRNIRSALHDDGVFIAVPVLGTANEARAFVNTLHQVGLCLASWNFVPFSDCGDRGAYPALVAITQGQPITVDFDREYSRIARMLGLN